MAGQKYVVGTHNRRYGTDRVLCETCSSGHGPLISAYCLPVVTGQHLALYPVILTYESSTRQLDSYSESDNGTASQTDRNAVK